jgi:HK97 family phage portal protein
VLHWGNGYVWSPPVRDRELFILPADRTFPFLDDEGGLWFHTTFANGKKMFLPDSEVLHLLINSADGLNGRGIVTYARETLGLQQSAKDTMGDFYAKGLKASAVMQMAGELSGQARQKVKDEYAASISDAYGLAVIDAKVAAFTPVTMKAIDMQFLQLMGATDVDIANFYGMPLHMLNMGKQAYNSNDQKFLEYLSVTLDPYLVQWEDAGRDKWISLSEQPYTYLKFVREALLRTDPETRAKINEVQIRSGQRSPEEVREKDDYSTYPGADKFYISSNVMEVGGKDATQPTQ